MKTAVIRVKQARYRSGVQSWEVIQQVRSATGGLVVCAVFADVWAEKILL